MARNELFGWIMFMLSGFLFLAIGIRSADTLTTIASVLWLIGCVSFLQSR